MTKFKRLGTALIIAALFAPTASYAVCDGDGCYFQDQYGQYKEYKRGFHLNDPAYARHKEALESRQNFERAYGEYLFRLRQEQRDKEEMEELYRSLRNPPNWRQKRY